MDGRPAALNTSSVLILSYHFYPSQEIGARRVTALARHLLGQGDRIVVVSAFDGRSVAGDDATPPGMTTIPVRPASDLLTDALVRLKRRLRAAPKTGRAALPKGDTESAVHNALRPQALEALRELYFRISYFPDEHRRWARRAARAAMRAGREHNARLIIASGPPHSVLLAGARTGRRLGIPFVADLRDPWSDYFATTQPQDRFELRLRRALERHALRDAAAVTTTTTAVARLLAGRHENLRGKVHVIRNGYDAQTAAPLRDTGHRLSMLFAGELYLGRDPFPLLAATEWLLAQAGVDPTRIELIFMGKAASYVGQSLQAWTVGKRCAAVVRILPPQSADVVSAAIERATVLVNLAQRQPLAVPAKTYEQLASGREILLICENACETAQVVAGISGVTQVDPANFAQLSATLLDLYRRHAMHGMARIPPLDDVTKFSRAAANESFGALLNALAPPAYPVGADLSAS